MHNCVMVLHTAGLGHKLFTQGPMDDPAKTPIQAVPLAVTTVFTLLHTLHEHGHKKSIRELPHELEEQDELESQQPPKNLKKCLKNVFVQFLNFL